MKRLPALLAIILTISTLNLSAQTTGPKLKITHLTGDLYVYTTYNLFGKELFPSIACTW
ncbi:hypothetical protein [Paraflavitalea speifideaquila]|uniref:hypothetical protein n=1 Tax=Paraflavitalea speifideaquila TaxID=3076558 RepID=UPI0028ECA3A9|nr:hypothetical protein [Paraflavitalea speifideiaquila]